MVAERLRMEWKRLIPKLLEVDDTLVHWHITECILDELTKLGKDYQEMLNIALTLPILKCRHKHGHTPDMDASACIKAFVEPKNDGKWIILSQDKDLRSSLRLIPGTPLLLISNNVLVLELPSKASKLYNQTHEIEKTTLRPDELKAVKQAVHQISSSSSSSLSSTNTGTSSLNNKKFHANTNTGSSNSNGANGTVVNKKRRKGPSEPNPLSVKRKRVTPPSGTPKPSLSSSSSNTQPQRILPTTSSSSSTIVTTGNNHTNDDPNGQKKQRRRKHKHSKGSTANEGNKNHSNTTIDHDHTDEDV